MLLLRIQREEQRLGDGGLVAPAARIESSLQLHNSLSAFPTFKSSDFTYFFTYFFKLKPIPVYKLLYKTKYLYTTGVIVDNRDNGNTIRSIQFPR